MLCSQQLDVVQLPNPENKYRLIRILPAASAQPKSTPGCEHRLCLVSLFMGDVMMEQVTHRALRGISKHKLYSKDWSRNYTKLRKTSKNSMQFLSSTFFQRSTPPVLTLPGSHLLLCSTWFLARSLPSYSLLKWMIEELLFKNSMSSATRWLSSRTSMPCQVMQGLLQA